jgi:hypothetical protein
LEEAQANVPPKQGGGIGAGGILFVVGGSGLAFAGYLKSDPAFRKQVDEQFPQLKDVTKAIDEFELPFEIPKMPNLAVGPRAGDDKPAPAAKAEKLKEKIVEGAKTEAPAPKKAAKAEKVEEAAPVATKAPTKAEKADEAYAIPSKAASVLGATVDDQMSEVYAQTAAIRNDLQQRFIGDIGGLSQEQLRLRVAELVAELQERTKWEALRLHEALQRIHRDSETKFKTTMETEAAKNEERLGREMRMLEEQLSRRERNTVAESEQKIQADMKEQLEAAQAEYKAAMEDSLTVQKEAMEQSHELKLMELEAAANHGRIQDNDNRMAAIKKLETKVKAMEQVHSTHSENSKLSAQVHAVSAALLEFKNKVVSCKPFGAELKALRSSQPNDPIISAALDSVPSAAANSGVRTVQQLVTRYQSSVQGAAMTAAYTPEGSGILGHLMASVTTALLFAPKSGALKGSDAEARLSRAALKLESGDLKAAVAELSQMQGLPAEAVRCVRW